VIAYVIQEVG